MRDNQITFQEIIANLDSKREKHYHNLLENRLESFIMATAELQNGGETVNTTDRSRSDSIAAEKCE